MRGLSALTLDMLIWSIVEINYWLVQLKMKPCVCEIKVDCLNPQSLESIFWKETC